jgi:hypothetical protein
MKIQVLNHKNNTYKTHLSQKKDQPRFHLSQEYSKNQIFRCNTWVYHGPSTSESIKHQWQPKILIRQAFVFVVSKYIFLVTPGLRFYFWHSNAAA